MIGNTPPRVCGAGVASTVSRSRRHASAAVNPAKRHGTISPRPVMVDALGTGHTSCRGSSRPRPYPARSPSSIVKCQLMPIVLINHHQLRASRGDADARDRHVAWSRQP